MVLKSCLGDHVVWKVILQAWKSPGKLDVASKPLENIKYSRSLQWTPRTSTQWLVTKEKKKKESWTIMILVSGQLNVSFSEVSHSFLNTKEAFHFAMKQLAQWCGHKDFHQTNMWADWLPELMHADVFQSSSCNVHGKIDSLQYTMPFNSKCMLTVVVNDFVLQTSVKCLLPFSGYCVILAMHRWHGHVNILAAPNCL